MKIISLFLAPILAIQGSSSITDDEIHFSLTQENGSLHIIVSIDHLISTNRFRFATGFNEVYIQSSNPDDFVSELTLISSQNSPHFNMVLSSNLARSFLYSIDDFEGTIGAMYGSSFATVAGSILLIPRNFFPIQEFEMIVRPVEPERHCFDYRMEYVNATLLSFHDGEDVYSRMAMRVGVSLEPMSNSLDDDGVLLDSNSRDNPVFFSMVEIQTESDCTSIPGEIFSVIQTAIRSVIATTSNDDMIFFNQCNTFIDELPSIRFMVYNEVSDSPSLFIVLSPRDYFDVDVNGDCEMKLCRSNQFVSDRFGANFLKHVVLLIDYNNHIFGFCDSN